MRSGKQAKITNRKNVAHSSIPTNDHRIWIFQLSHHHIYMLRLVGRWARKPVNHTSWVAVVTPTDRPKSVRNRCVIELFCGVVYVVTLPF